MAMLVAIFRANQHNDGIERLPTVFTGILKPLSAAFALIARIVLSQVVTTLQARIDSRI
jgi:hypothetical protein